MTRYESTDGTLPSTLAFEASAVFDGPREGMEFKQGSEGLGYYQTSAARVYAKASSDRAEATKAEAGTAMATESSVSGGEPSVGAQKDSPKNEAAPGPAAWGVGEEKRSQQVN